MHATTVSSSTMTQLGAEGSHRLAAHSQEFAWLCSKQGLGSQLYCAGPNTSTARQISSSSQCRSSSSGPQGVVSAGAPPAPVVSLAPPLVSAGPPPIPV